MVRSLPFPSMPIGFWNDPEGRRYRSAYFERFPHVWAHCDYVELTREEEIIFFGRSDAVLNPGGVRIGPAEIYRVVESFHEVRECLAMGQEKDGDVRVILVVQLLEDGELTSDLKDRIRRAIREAESPRHVPARIIAVPEIPRTLSGKIGELVVREVIHGRPVTNRDALVNPQALEAFKGLPKLE